MYIVITYDSKNSNKFRLLLKKYLIWQQNSVYAGNISKTNYNKLKKNIEDIIDKENDSICIFHTEVEEINIYNIGKIKGYNDNFI